MAFSQIEERSALILIYFVCVMWNMYFETAIIAALDLTLTNSRSRNLVHFVCWLWPMLHIAADRILFPLTISFASHVTHIIYYLISLFLHQWFDPLTQNLFVSIIFYWDWQTILCNHYPMIAGTTMKELLCLSQLQHRYSFDIWYYVILYFWILNYVCKSERIWTAYALWILITLSFIRFLKQFAICIRKTKNHNKLNHP